MMRGLRYLTVLISLLAMSAALAVRVDNLYTATVVVHSKSQQERDALLPEALMQVLIKVSGNSALATLPQIAKQLPQAAALLQQFHYQALANEPSTWTLSLNFDAKGVKKVLNRAGLGLWNAERPLLLTWLVIDAEGKTQLITEANAQAVTAFTQEAERRGLAYALPVLDLQEINAISASDVLSGDFKKLSAAAARYNASGILVGKLEQQDKSWRATWTLIFQGETMQWQVSDPVRQTVVVRGLDFIVDALASRLAVVDTQVANNQVTITIDAIASVADYAKITQYLQSLPMVADLSLQGIQAGTVRYQLTLGGNTQALISQLALQKLLIPAKEGTIADSVTLHYKLAS